jgi:hypothetical protein
LEGWADALVGLRVVGGSELEIFEADEIELIGQFGFGEVIGLALGANAFVLGGGHLREGSVCGVLGEWLVVLGWAEG